MGRRNTQVEPDLHCETDHFSWGSIVESTHWMVLRRPSELAAETGQVEFSGQASIFPCRKQRATRRSFGSPIEYELVDSNQLESIFKKGDWPAFYKQYSGASGILTWSRVGFSAEGTQALFYVSHRCGGLCGGGRYILMEKQARRWVIGTEIVVWVS
jgi:hypothetical protein